MITAGQKARYIAEMGCNALDPRHGTETGYRYGCRCARCKDAHKERGAEQYRQEKFWRDMKARYGIERRL